MKLSQLKALVAAIEVARRPENQDPDVRFWISHEEARREPSRLESDHFMDLEIQVRPEDLREHQVLVTASGAVQGYGDFTLPLTRVDFYRD